VTSQAPQQQHLCSSRATADSCLGQLSRAHSREKSAWDVPPPSWGPLLWTAQGVCDSWPWHIKLAPKPMQALECAAVLCPALYQLTTSWAQISRRKKKKKKYGAGSLSVEVTVELGDNASGFYAINGLWYDSPRNS